MDKIRLGFQGYSGPVSCLLRHSLYSTALKSFPSKMWLSVSVGIIGTQGNEREFVMKSSSLEGFFSVRVRVCGTVSVTISVKKNNF